jgi:hypothetical protein
MKKLKNGKRWDFIKDHLEEIVKEECLKNDTFLQVLLSLKRVFNKTPISLKTAYRKEDLYYRELALYLLVNYSNALKEEIASEFKIELSNLEEYKNQEHYEKIYRQPLEEYFQEKIVSYAFEQDCFLDCWEYVSDEKFKELQIQVKNIASLYKT